MEPRYLGMNGRIDALAAAWLFAHDHLFFADGDVTWDGSHHSINALQSNVGLETEAPIFWSNRQVLAQGAADLVLWLEKDEELIVPRDQISPGLYSAIGEGDLTGLTLFNLQACGRAFSFLNGSNVTAYGSFVGMESSSEDESNWESVQDVLQMAGMDELLAIPAAKSSARVVVFDTRLANGIPNFFSLVTKMYEDMLDYNEIDLPYILIFMSTFNFDADPFLDDVGDPVPGAASAPVHIETNALEWHTSRDSEEDAGCAVEAATAEDGNKDEDADEEASEREVVTAMLRLLVLAAELSGKSLFPKELLDELERAENGDESVDLEGLAERLNACVLDAQVDDSSNASFDGGTAVDGQCGLSQEPASLCRADVAQAAQKEAEEKEARSSELAAKWETANEFFHVPGQADPVAFAISGGHALVLNAYGRCAAVGDDSSGQCGVSEWGSCVAVAAGDWHSVALREEGTCVAAGFSEDGRCDVSGWRHVVDVAAGDSFTVALLADGTCCAAGGDEGVCEGVAAWSAVDAIEAGSCHVVGLKANGTCVAAGDNNSGQCDVSYWCNIVAIAAGSRHTVAVKRDGSCIATGQNGDGQCDVLSWHDVVSVSAGHRHTVGLCADGTCIAVGSNKRGQCDVSRWQGVVAVAAGGNLTVALLSDGTCVSAGAPGLLQEAIAKWTPFCTDALLAERTKMLVRLSGSRAEHAELLREERRMAEKRAEQIKKEKEAEAAKAAEQERRRRMAAGKSQHCGGSFKGLFSKKCEICKKPKDY